MKMPEMSPKRLGLDTVEQLQAALKELDGKKIPRQSHNEGFDISRIISGSSLNQFFYAKITSSSGIYYAWSEVYRLSSTAWDVLPGGRTGTVSINPAIELNGSTGVAADTIVMMRYNRYDTTYKTLFFFQAPTSVDGEVIFNEPVIFNDSVTYEDNSVTVNTTQNNYDVTNKTVIQFNPTVNVNITGFIPYDTSKAQMIIVLNNNPTYNLVLIPSSGGSSVNNQIYVPGAGNLTITPYTSVILVYSPVDLKWIAIFYPPRAFTVVAVPTGYTLNFGITASISVSPPGILSLPVQTITGTPTWTPTAGTYPIVWNQADKILWIWDGAAWQSVGFSNPMTTAGDIIYGGAAGVGTRLAANGRKRNALLSQQSLVSTIPVWAYANFPLFVQVADVTVTNTTTETTLITGATPLLDAGEMDSSSTLRITLAGHQDFDGVTDTIRFKIYFGSTVVLDSGTLPTPGPTTNSGWRLEALLTIRNSSVAGTIIGQGKVDLGGPINEVYSFMMTATATTTVDFATINNAIDVTAIWSVASAGLSITCTNVIIEQIR